MLSIAVSFETYLDKEKGHLAERVQSQARFMEAVAKFNQKHSADYPGGSRAATLSQIRDTQGKI